MTRGLVWQFLAVFSGLLGCSGEPPLTALRERVVDGETSGAEQDGVLLLRGLLQDDKEFVCTCSLVAPNLVLTAQHCVSYLSEGIFACNARGELTDNPEGGGQLGLGLPPERIEIYGGSTPRKAPLARASLIVSTHSTNICQNDIAFVVLDAALDLPLVPLRQGRAARAGELGMLVGYGMDAGERGIDYRVQNREQKRDLEIRGVGPDTIEDGVTIIPPRSLLLEGPSGCIGDSGGPLLAQSTGAILGLYSLQSASDCGSPRVTHQLVHVPPFQRLMQDAFDAAGATPLLEEPEPEPETAGGAAGVAGSANPPSAGASTHLPAELPASSSGCSYSRSPSADLTWCCALLVLVRWRRRRSATAV
jgi:Trypsin